MSGIYRGKPIQDAGGVSVRLVESASIDYDTLNAEGTGYATTTVRWLSPDDFTISSSFETLFESGKPTGDEYLKESFLVPPLYFTGSFFGEFEGTDATFSGSITASGASAFYGPVSITGTTTHTGSVYISGALRLDPTNDPGNTYPSSSFLYQSASNTNLGTDLYIRQDGQYIKFNWLADQLFTGLLYGGVVTYSGNTVYISSGSGIIVDYNANSLNESAPTITYVTWPNLSFIPTYLAVRQVTYISLNSSGAVVQSYTPFTRDDYYDRIVLGAVGHFDLTNVTAFQGAAQTEYGQPMQTNTFIDAFGPLKLSGYELTAHAKGFRLSVASGNTFIHGGFYDYDPTRPSTISTSAQATASLAYVYQNGSGGIYFDTNGGAFYTNVTSSKYDDGTGTPATVSNNNWTIQRVYSDPRTGILYIYYGRTVYVTKAAALAGLSTDTFSEGDTFDFTTFLGYLVLKSNTGDLSNTTDNSILAGGLFRGVSAGGGSSGGGTTSPGGSNTQIQYNNASNFGGVPVLTYDGTTLRGTGSFSGSFTGALIGTSSWATNSTTASYVLNAVSSSFATSASHAVQAGNASTIDINVFGSPVDSYLLMSNVAGTTGVAIGGDADLRYNSSTNVLTVGNVSATTLTGSLLGTASNAVNALTASFINSASTNAFVQGGNSFGAQALLGTNDNQSLAFETNNATRMFISSSGNVGIGTVTPGYGLEVGNTGIYYNPGQLLITTSGSVNKEGSFIASSTGRTLQLGISDNSVVPVGIDMFETNNTFGSTYLNFRVNNADLVRMTGSLVGIGTTTPLFTLDVNGSGRFTGNLTVTGSLIAPTITGSLQGTASWANNAVTSSYVLNAISSSFASTASLAQSAQTALTASAVGTIPTGSSDIFYPTTVLYPGPNKLNQVLYVSNSFYYDAGKRQFIAPTFVQTATGIGFVGTASFATSASFAVSASWAPSVASNPFPYTGSAIISGSLTITGSLQVGVPGASNAAIDTTVGTLSRGASVSIDWPNRYLYNSVGGITVDWENCTLNDNSATPSIDWNNRVLTDPSNVNVAFEYSNSTSTISQLYHRAVIPGQVQRSIAETPIYAGQLIQATINVGVTDYQLVFLDTDGTWKGTKATVANGATKMLGIAVDTAGGYVLIEGDVGVSDDNSQGGYVVGADHGLPVYVSGNTGEMTTTAPSGVGELVRIVGHIYYQSTTDTNWWTMKFRPSNDWYEQ